MTLKEKFEKETGRSAMNGTNPTVNYVEWLEKELKQMTEDRNCAAESFYDIRDERNELLDKVDDLQAKIEDLIE